jgi:type I restriction enzyme S subunit
MSTGGTPTSRNRLKEEKLLGMQIPLPPLAEQGRIVGRIEALAVKIAEAKRLGEEGAVASHALQQSMLDALIPLDTPRCPLKELIEPGTTISYGVLVPGADEDNGVPFVRVQDLHPRTPPARPSKRIAPQIDAQYRRTRLIGNEVLVGVVGSIGKVGIVPPAWAGANIARAVCRIVPGPTVDRRFLTVALQSKAAQDYFRDATRTLAQPTLNVGQLEQTLIPTLSLPQQRRIVAELDALQGKVDALRTLQSETAAELDALLPADLAQAFAGRL